jgi:hypothetical protein
MGNNASDWHRNEAAMLIRAGIGCGPQSEVGGQMSDLRGQRSVFKPPGEGRDGMHNRQLWKFRLARQTFLILARTSYEREAVVRGRKSEVGTKNQNTNSKQIQNQKDQTSNPFLNISALNSGFV